MKKYVIYQSPAFLYEVAPVFYRELNKLQYFDGFYLATDMRDPYGLGDNVHVVSLERDFGWEENLRRLLLAVPEDMFVMMCDDHVAVPQTELNLDPYFALMERTPELGRLQLSPPTLNYYRFLRARRLPAVIPDDQRDWYPYDKRYRWHVNFQPSLWRKDFLLDIIQGGGSKSQLELRASERARMNTQYLSGYIGCYALRFENFFASCQVHHTDPDYRMRDRKPHYREEFVRYAMAHGLDLDPTKRVHVRRVGFSASVPVTFYMQHYHDQEAYRQWALRRSFLKHHAFKLGKRIRARVAPYVSFSSR